MASSTNIKSLAMVAHEKIIADLENLHPKTDILITGTTSQSPDTEDFARICLYLETKPDKITRIMFPCDDAKAEELHKLCNKIKIISGKRCMSSIWHQYIGMLDSNDFVTTFNLAEHAILDKVARLWDKQRSTNMVVHAELEALQVYLAGSTGLSITANAKHEPYHFGTLLVCLPSEHSGCHLAYGTGSKEPKFDAMHPVQSSEQDTTQWFALPHGSTYEVRGPTSGHCIFLSYQLFVSPQPITSPSSFLLEEMPLYKRLQSLLPVPAFMTRGGEIGFNCKGSYHHTTPRIIKNGIHNNLVGVDLQVYETFKQLGLAPVLKPVFMGTTALRRLLEQRYQTLYPDADRKRGPLVMIGEHLTEMLWLFRKEHEYLPDEDQFPHRIAPNIIWLNDPNNTKYGTFESQIKFDTPRPRVTCGRWRNQDPDARAMLTRLAIVAKVPQFTQRGRVASPERPCPHFPLSFNVPA